MDQSRRKAAIALHSLGDEITPDSESRSKSKRHSHDASAREDEEPEAVERRRRARQEIIDRGRLLEEKRRSKQGHLARAKTLNDLVDKDGFLKSETDEIIALSKTTATETVSEHKGLRHRHTESQAAAQGSAFANPFSDETQVESPATLQEEHASRSHTPTLPASPISPPVPPKPDAYQPQQLLIDTEEASNHPSEQLVDLTPTTSASSPSADLAELSDNHHSSQSYWSVNEWAQNSAPQAFYSPPRSEPAGIEERIQSPAAEPSHDREEHAGQLGSDVDMMSEDGLSVDTPDTWTEVGSQVSENL